MRKIIYLFGYGRSGTTLFSLLLDRHPDIVSTGELINLPVRGWIKNTYCSCGKRANDCHYWSNIRDLWEKESMIPDPEEYGKLIQNYKRYLPLYGTGKLNIKKEDADLQKFIQTTRTLYEAVYKVSGKSVIFDSSKIPVWGILIRQSVNADFHPVFMVRDGRGIITSLERSRMRRTNAKKSGIYRVKTLTSTSIKWAVANILCEYYLKQSGAGHMRIRYEDFVASPDKILGTLIRSINLDAELMNTGNNSNVSHVISGNKMRIRGDTEIREDIEWMSQLSLSEEIIYWFLSGFLGIRYGYRPRLINRSPV